MALGPKVPTLGFSDLAEKQSRRLINNSKTEATALRTSRIKARAKHRLANANLSLHRYHGVLWKSTRAGDLELGGRCGDSRL